MGLAYMPATPVTISIVTPSYNQGSFIEETIRSVLSQEGDLFLEYLVIDGGSTDQSLEIIRHYDQLVRTGAWPCKCLGITFQWVSEKDQGQAHAVNKGLRKASGDILGWINSDDLYFPGALQLVSEHFQGNPNDDFVFGDGDVIDEGGNVKWEWLSRPYNLKLLKSYHFLWNDFTNYIMQQATFWRRRVLDRIGFLDESLHYAMDVEYWIRAGQTGLVLTHLPVKLGKFRMISGTKSLSSPLAFWPDMLEIFRRYNGASVMSRFFAEFLYSVGLHNGFDVILMHQHCDRVFKRWKSLPEKEYEELKTKAKDGFYRACLMLSSTAYDQGEDLKARVLFHQVITSRLLLALHPIALLVLTKRLLGRRSLTLLNKIRDWMVMRYRRTRYLYRYQS